MSRVQNIAILSLILVVSLTLFGLLTYLIGNLSSENDPKCESANFERRIQASRGFIRDSQENTIKAILDAFAVGYEPQFDVRATRDGHLVLFADENAKRMCADGRKVIHELKLSEVKELKLASEIGNWRYSSEGEIPTYEETLAAICKNDADRVFQVTLHAKDAAPRLSEHDEEAATNLVKLFKESPCKSNKVIFGVGQPRVGNVVKEQLEESDMTNQISFYMEPNTWVLGEAFWIRARIPFLLSGASILDFQHVLWGAHNESIAKLREAGWCMGSYGKDSVEEAFEADVWRTSVPTATWDLIGDELRSWQNQSDIDSYEPNEASFFWVMLFTLIFALIVITVLPNLICIIQNKPGAKVAPAEASDEENPDTDTAAPSKETPAPAKEKKEEKEEKKEAEPVEPVEPVETDAAPAPAPAPAPAEEEPAPAEEEKTDAGLPPL